MKAQHELDQYNKEIRLKDKNIRTKTTEIEDLKKKLRQFEHKQQSKEKDAEEATKNSKEFLKRAQQLEKVHKWISEEKDKFGNENTFYNFNNYTFEIGKREIESRKDRNKELLQTINTKYLTCK
jgi:chromosome segregation ATPase